MWGFVRVISGHKKARWKQDLEGLRRAYEMRKWGWRVKTCT